LAHQTAPQVFMGDGSVSRFCQRCHSLQPLAEFEGAQRTCAESLLRHNARRRERKSRAAANLVAGLERVGSGSLQGTGGTGTPGSGSDNLPGAAAASAGVDLQRFTVEVKLPHCATPASLPPGDILQAALAESLGSVVDTACVSIAPGCVRLIIDALQRSTADAASQAQAIAEKLAAALRRRGGASAGQARAAGVLSEAAPPSLLPIAALLLPPAGGVADMVALPVTCTLPAGAATMSVRCWGRGVRCEVGSDGQVSLQLSAVPYAGGCLLVEARGSDGERLHRPRAVVASRDAVLVSELNDAYQQGVLQESDMQPLLHILGDALTLHATWEVQCAAAKAALRAGWGATLRQLLQAADTYRAGAGDELAVVASAYSDSASVLSVLHTRVPATAWADAARRLRAALSDDTFELPHHAAYCAFIEAQSDAGANHDVVRLMRAVSTVMLRDAEDDVDVALDAEDKAADAAAYETFRALQCAHEHFVAHALGILGLLLRIQKAFTALGHRNTWPSDAELGPSAAAILRAFKLHPLAAGAPLVEPRSVPWPVVVRSLRVFTAYCLFPMLPFHIAAFVVSWRLRQGRAPSARLYYAVLGYAISFAYMTGHFVGDLCIMHVTNAAPEWPVEVNTLLHSVFLSWVWRKALFSPTLVRLSMLGFGLCFYGPLLFVAGPRVLFSNVAAVALISALFWTAVRAGAREQAMRAMYVARFKVVGKAKQA